jgi:hypothetical protein
MNYDFTSLPKTRKEVTDYYNYVKVPSLDNLDSSRLIFSQEQGSEYLQQFEAKFGTIENYNIASERYIQFKGAWCTSRTAE